MEPVAPDDCVGVELMDAGRLWPGSAPAPAGAAVDAAQELPAGRQRVERSPVAAAAGAAGGGVRGSCPGVPPGRCSAVVGRLVAPPGTHRERGRARRSPVLGWLLRSGVMRAVNEWSDRRPPSGVTPTGSCSVLVPPGSGHPGRWRRRGRCQCLLGTPPSRRTRPRSVRAPPGAAGGGRMRGRIGGRIGGRIRGRTEIRPPCGPRRCCTPAV